MVRTSIDNTEVVRATAGGARAAAVGPAHFGTVGSYGVVWGCVGLWGYVGFMELWGCEVVNGLVRL